MHGGHPPAAAVTPQAAPGGCGGDATRPPPRRRAAAPPPAWRVALSLFTVIPAGFGGDLDEGAAARALFWLPVLGAAWGWRAAGDGFRCGR